MNLQISLNYPKIVSFILLFIYCLYSPKCIQDSLSKLQLSNKISVSILQVVTLSVGKGYFLIFICLSKRREEVHGEAQRVLRCLPGRNKKESASKQMPSFPEMVYYIQEKVGILFIGN